MPSTPLPADVRALLRKPNPAVVATVRPDGRPHSAATWYLYEDDGLVLLSMASTRLRLQFLAENPVVSLTVIDAESWYHHVTLMGTVASLDEDPDLVDIDRLSRHYRGTEYRDRVGARVSARVTVVSWHGWDVSGPITVPDA